MFPNHRFLCSTAVHVLVLVLVGTLLSGCGDGGSDAPTPDPDADGATDGTDGDGGTDGDTDENHGSDGTADLPPEAAAMAGGTPIPDGSYEVRFPVFHKSAITFVSEAGDGIHGTVGMEGDGSFGRIGVDTATGTASGSLAIPVARMRTGLALQDQHMRGADWLNAASHPHIELRELTCTRVAPTVWKAVGQLVIRGVARPLETWVNVRYLPDFPVGDSTRHLVRVSASFPVDLHAHGLDHSDIGGPTVDQVWSIHVELYGVKGE